MLIIKVKNGKTTTKAYGNVAEIDRDMAAAYGFIAKHAEFSDGVNHKILNGHWAQKMDADVGIGVTD